MVGQQVQSLVHLEPRREEGGLLVDGERARQHGPEPTRRQLVEAAADGVGAGDRAPGERGHVGLALVASPRARPEPLAVDLDDLEASHGRAGWEVVDMCP